MRLGGEVDPVVQALLEGHVLSEDPRHRVVAAYGPDVGPGVRFAIVRVGWDGHWGEKFEPTFELWGIESCVASRALVSLEWVRMWSVWLVLL